MDIFQDKELLETFITEVNEHIESLENNIIDLNKSDDTAQLINEIFRSFHTIKGSAHYLNLVDLVNITHNTENLVGKLRDGSESISDDIIDILLEALDLIKIFIDGFVNNTDVNVSDKIVPFFEKLKKYLPELKIEKKETGDNKDDGDDAVTESRPVDDIKKFVIFKIKNTYFAFDVSNIIEIIHYQEITRVPFVEKEFVGVINFRGDLVPLIDLRIKMGVENSITDNVRIIVLEYENSKVGIMVDEIFEIVKVNTMEIEKEAQLKEDIDNEWMEGVFLFENNIIIILDSEKLLKRDIAERKEV